MNQQRYNPINPVMGPRAFVPAVKPNRKPKPRKQKRARVQVDAAVALARAQQGQSLANYPAIFAGLMAKGIPEADIKPRENVFHIKAWNALGRRVKKGEHGIRIATVFPGREVEVADPDTGVVTTESRGGRPGWTFMFHISQTVSKAEAAAEPKPAPAPDLSVSYSNDLTAVEREQFRRLTTDRSYKLPNVKAPAPTLGGASSASPIMAPAVIVAPAPPTPVVLVPAPALMPWQQRLLNRQ